MLPFLNRYSKNNSFFFLMAFLLGLIFGDYASVLKQYILPTLVLIMSLSTTKITLSELIHFKKYIRDIFFVFLINYLFLSGLILLANHLLVKDHDLYVGFVVMAAVPPAVAVLAFTYLLKGEMMVSLKIGRAHV